ncbi:unnamed protein product, partial [marine sediment metagenome]
DIKEYYEFTKYGYFSDGGYTSPVFNFSLNLESTIMSYDNLTFYCDEPTGTNCSGRGRAINFNLSDTLWNNSDAVLFFSGEYGEFPTVSGSGVKIVKNYLVDST